jgi:membrane associated rhomboid family serine protease
MLPLSDRNPVSRPSVLTWLIFGACLAAYFLWQPSPLGETSEDVEFYLENAAIPCELVEGRPLDVTEVIVTFEQGNTQACNIDDGRSPAFLPEKNVWLATVVSMFLHGSVMHIGGNLLFLWVFANNIEDAMGTVRFGLFYLAGGIVATASHVLLNLDSTVPLVGASGAIAAVMGAYMVLYPHARIRTAVFVIFILLVELRAVWVLGFWFVLQFFTDPNAGVAWAAHVGGFVFGMVVGLLMRARRPPVTVARSPYGWPA